MEVYKKPLFIIVAVGASLAALGALLGWFTIGNQLVRDLAESELNKKQTLSLGITMICLLTCASAAKLQKQRLAFISVIVAIYGLILIINQKPDAAIAEQIGVVVKPGYWMSIIGTLAMIVSSGIIGLKGFDLHVKKETSEN